MRRIASFLLPVAMVALTASGASAQRGGRGAGAMHIGAGFRSPSFAPAPHAMPSFAPRVSVSRTPAFQHPLNFSRPFAEGHFAEDLNRRRPGGHDGGRRPYPRNGGRGGPRIGVYPYNTYLVPNIVGFPYGFDPFFYGDDDYDDQSAAPQPEDSSENYAEPVPPEEAEAPEGEPAAGAYRPEYQPAAEASIATQPATTLVFNNGRPNEEIHNYVLTATTLYGFDDGARREIPLSEIDLPATIAANRSAGVDFTLPDSM